MRNDVTARLRSSELRSPHVLPWGRARHRSRVPWSGLAAPLVLVLVAACGTDDPFGPTSAQAQGAVQFQEQQLQGWCDYFVRCGRVAATDRPRCIDSMHQMMRLVSTGLDIAASIRDGKTRVDASYVKPCLDGLAGLSCRRDLGDVPACNAVFVGMLAVGAPCYGDAECESGVCSRNGSPCPGTCREHSRGGAGTACFTDRDCIRGLGCENGICAAAPPGTSPGDGCRTDGACSPDQYCSLEEGQCAAGGASGQGCNREEACDAGLACVGLRFDQSDPAAGTCRPWLDVGAACSLVSSDVSGCPETAPCDAASSTCRSGLAWIGKECARQEDCEDELVPEIYRCDLATHRCAALGLTGDPCDPDDPHGCFRTCDRATRRCASSC